MADIEIKHGDGRKVRVLGLPVDEIKHFKNDLEDDAGSWTKKGYGSMPFRDVNRVDEIRPDGSVNRNVWTKDGKE